MADFKFEVNSAGIGELMRSAEMLAIVEDAADAVAAVAFEMSGHNYDADAIVGPHRAVGMVKCADAAAYYSNLKHNTLLKALGSVKSE